MDPKRIVRAGYDAAAVAYTEHRQTHVEADLLGLLDELSAGTPAGSCVLDAGCGGGVIASLLVERFDVVGVDMSFEQLQLARQIAPRMRPVCQDITTLAAPDGFFSAICSIWTIIHVPRAEHLPLLANFRRMLRRGGLAIFSLGRTDWEGTERFFGADLWWSHFDRDTSLALVEQAGFEIVQVVDVDDRPGNKRAPFLLARAV
jgi:SAM-dependent methyltransferase